MKYFKSGDKKLEAILELRNKKKKNKTWNICNRETKKTDSIARTSKTFINIWGCLEEGVPTQPRERSGNIFKRKWPLVWVLKDKLSKGRGALWKTSWWAQQRGEAGDCRRVGTTGRKGGKRLCAGIHNIWYTQCAGKCCGTWTGT